MTDVNSQVQFQGMGAKYGVPVSDAGAPFAMNKYAGTGKVHPLSKKNLTTVQAKAAWDNLNPGAGGGSFQDFGDDGPAYQPVEMR